MGGFAHNKHGMDGPFLFGAFSAVDAMFAPVVRRFDVHQPTLCRRALYMDAVDGDARMEEMDGRRRRRTWRIPRFETPWSLFRHALLPFPGASGNLRVHLVCQFSLFAGKRLDRCRQDRVLQEQPGVDLRYRRRGRWRDSAGRRKLRPTHGSRIRHDGRSASLSASAAPISAFPTSIFGLPNFSAMSNTGAPSVRKAALWKTAPSASCDAERMTAGECECTTAITSAAGDRFRRG